MPRFKVHEGIPIPAKWDCLRKYDWEGMKIGSSIIRPVSMWGALRASAFKAAKTFGFKFTVRRMGKKVGCWRIE